MSSGSPALAAFPPELFPHPPAAIDVPAGRLAYVDTGAGEKPLLCVHGNPSWSFLYRRVFDEFAPGRRVVAPDHIGCGRSAKPQDWTYRVGDHIDNLEKLVLALDLTGVTLVCHDWGGAIGMGVAGRHPDRFERLVVMNTAAFCLPLLPFRISVCRWPVVGEWAVRGLNAFAGAATTMAVERPMDPGVKAGFLAPYHDWASRIATHRFVVDIPMDASHPSWDTMQAVAAGLDRLKQKPLLALWGMKDWCFTPAFLDEWLRRFPDAEVERYADVGHYTLEDSHERALPRIRRFLEAHGG